MSALTDALRAQGGTISEVVVRDLAPGRTGPAQIAAAGPRAEGSEAEYELLIEMIFEGSLLHYGNPRVIATDDRDLALLLGDQLYAMGLERLSVLGDLVAVAELADVISLVSQAHAHGDEALAAAVWKAGAVAVGWGPSDAHGKAKRLTRDAGAGAAAALLAAARSPLRDARSDVDDRLLEPFNSGAV